MGRPRKLNRTAQLHLRVSHALILDIGTFLWSDAHGKIPHGKLSEFCEEAIQEHLNRVRREIDGHNRPHQGAAKPIGLEGPNPILSDED
jgi:hypothetical protein